MSGSSFSQLQFLESLYAYSNFQNARATIMEIKKSEFEVEFVRRTKNLLKEYRGPNDMSIIINCSLGLVVLPYEIIKHTPSSFWDTEISNIPSLPAFHLSVFEPIEKIKHSVITYYPKTLKVLLRKIRNGLVHQYIEPVNRKGDFVGVIVRNYFDKSKTHQDLEIYFSQQELKEFALFIADEYLR